VRAIAAHPVVIVCGETGSGKSTQLPKICLDAGRGTGGQIGHTQPRRIAARAIAARIAEELGIELGTAVGYKVRFHDRTHADGCIKVMTDGILLAETQRDRNLRAYDTIIIDEAHERSLNIDFLLGYLKLLLRRRPDLKLIITSATIDPDRFSRHFDDAPVIEVSGRSHPVEVRYRPLDTGATDDGDRLMLGAILDAVDEAAAESGGDVLVFLSGEREIRETAEALRQHHPPGTEILPLYARLSATEQHRVFESHPGRRIVLATNVAETSLTVPGIRAVVDPGFARVSRYGARTRVQRLPVEAISQASARQRAGRCGRLGPGVCIRLYAEKDYETREAFTVPEILRTNLASVILRMKALGLGDVDAFPFIEKPQRAMIRDGYDTLRELGAVDDRGLTTLGRDLARLPTDPRIGRMILAAREEACLAEVLVIASVLASQDPRDRPMDQRPAADAAHRELADPDSDFMSYLRIWEAYHEAKRHRSWNKLRQWCRTRFLSFVRMREWVHVHQQLRTLVTEGGHHPNKEPADSDRVHRALLVGLVRNIGFREDGKEFTGAQDSKFHIHPGSTAFKKPPRWVMASEIVQTTRRYARCVAPIQPAWVEHIAPHLLRRSYSDPHWDRHSGKVIAWERVSVYGLPIVPRRRAHYGPIDPAAAREIFIHHALVEGELESDAAFMVHNRALIEDIRAFEAKQRKRDVLVDVGLQYAFYDERIPADVCTARGLAGWRRTAERRTPDLLRMTRADLVVPGSTTADPDLYPDTLDVGGLELPLEYRLEPGAADDGVTVTIPLARLGQVPAARLEWMVPALLEEKLVALLRTLPKALRREFVPAPDFAGACAERLAFGEGALAESLGEALHRATGVAVPADAWQPESVPDHLRMNIRVIGDAGAVLGEGRDLSQLQETLFAQTRVSFSQLAGDFDRAGITTWDMGDLPEAVELSPGGASLVGYPALVNEGAAAALRLFDTSEAAAGAHRGGLRRLFVLHCRDELAFHVNYLPGIDEMRLHHAPLGDGSALDDALTLLIADRAFVAADPGVRTAAQFQARLDAGWNDLARCGAAVGAIVADVLRAHQEATSALAGADNPVWAATVGDVRGQLTHLAAPGFLVATPPARLEHLPRYFRAIVRRLAKLPGGGHAKDERRIPEVQAAWEQFATRRAEHVARGLLDPALDEYRWLLEEFRVSLFAQELKTAVPVSPKRLAEQWARVR